MSSNHHDDHHYTEAKPVSFTVPFILASVLLLIIFSLVSVCDPKHGTHYQGEGLEHYGGHPHGNSAAEADAQPKMEDQHQGGGPAAETVTDTLSGAPAIAPEVEGKHEGAHH